MNDFDPKNLQKVKLSDLLFNDWNPKDNEKEYQKVKKSLEIHGLITPIFVRETDNGLEVVDGNQRVRAVKELGYTEIYVYNLGPISEAEAKKLVLWFQTQVPFDTIMLAPLALELNAVGMELPFDSREMEKFAELEAFDMNTAFQEEEPIEETPKEQKEKMESFKLKLSPEDFDTVMYAVELVSQNENVNEGRALELLLETGMEWLES